MQMVAVESPVIYPFAGSAVIVNLLIFICPPGDRGIEAEVPNRDIRVNGPEFMQGGDGADAVVPAGIQKTDMEVNANTGIVRTKHIKGVPEIKGIFVAVPSPAGIRVREMALAGTGRDS